MTPNSGEFTARKTGIPQPSALARTARDGTELRRMEMGIVGVIDRERERLGRDLHDGLCQTLSGIAALATTLGRRLSTHGEAAAAAEISQLLELAIIEARHLARGLNPVALNGSGLVRALEAFAATVRLQFRVSCTFHCNLPLVNMAPGMEMHLYRIVQESVCNAIRHGRAEQVTVSLYFTDTTGTLTVTDNGIGIPECPCEGTGMHTMGYRARLIGASLSIRPDPRRGTRMECVFSHPPSSPEPASNV